MQKSIEGLPDVFTVLHTKNGVSVKTTRKMLHHYLQLLYGPKILIESPKANMGKLWHANNTEDSCITLARSHSC